MMSAAIASTLAAIVVSIIGAAAGASGWGLRGLAHVRVEQSGCDRHVTIRDSGNGGRNLTKRSPNGAESLTAHC